MIRPCIRYFFHCCLCFLLCINVVAQRSLTEQVRKFLLHLEKHGLYREKLFLLQTFKDSTEEINIQKGWTYFKLHQYDSSLHHYNKVPLSLLYEHKFHHNYFLVLLKNKQYESFKGDLKVNEILLHRKYDARYLMIADILQKRLPVGSLAFDTIPYFVKTPYKKYLLMSKKCGMVAGLFSAVIPGSGKWYIQKKGQGFNMLLANLFLGAQAYESYRRAGLSSARFVVFGSVFSLFYLSNIAGSVWGVKKAKKEAFEQLQYEINEHYLSDYHFYPSGKD